jgi:hypothetical protein
VPTEEVADHTVYDELRKGYHLRGRLLRPAMVRVAVTPQEQKSRSATNTRSWASAAARTTRR